GEDRPRVSRPPLRPRLRRPGRGRRRPTAIRGGAAQRPGDGPAAAVHERRLRRCGAVRRRARRRPGRPRRVALRPGRGGGRPMTDAETPTAPDQPTEPASAGAAPEQPEAAPVGWLPHTAEELFGAGAGAEEAYGLLTVDVPPAAWITALETAR